MCETVNAHATIDGDFLGAPRDSERSTEGLGPMLAVAGSRRTERENQTKLRGILLVYSRVNPMCVRRGIRTADHAKG